MNWDEPHFWESWVQFHSPHRGLITARPVESRTHFNRTCLTKWSRLKDQKQMRNKVIGMYQSGKGYKPFLRLWDFSAAVRAIKWRRLGTVVNLPRVAGRPKLLHLWMAKKNKMKVLEWPSQSRDLNPMAMLWPDLKQAVYARKPSNVAELKQFCKEEWAKTPPQRCERLIASYRKRLIAVVAAKGGTTSY